MFFYWLKMLVCLLIVRRVCGFYYENEDATKNAASLFTRQNAQIEDESNKEFWENFYQNSLLSTKTKYNVVSGEKVCFTCPIDRATFTNLYQEASKSLKPNQTIPAKISIAWSAQFSENRMLFFCRNNTKIKTGPIFLSNEMQNSDGGSNQLDYSCENSRLCLQNVKLSYPENYQCMVKSYVLNVKLNVIVQLNYVLMFFEGDSVKFDYQKEVQVIENQVFTIKCEVPETNPVSNVNAYIDNQPLKLTRLDKKSFDDRMNVNTYFFDVNATRSMNGKRVKCEARMRDLPPDLANSLDLRSHISKDYTLLVYYHPTCVYPERHYRAGVNRTLIIECPINGSNPDVTYYKLIAPSIRTKFEQIDTDLNTLRRLGRYRVTPSSQADFGLYECIPRSLVGTTKCDIQVELGATPNPPEQCSVQFAKVNNKTFAQFSCRPGFNQGGLTSFLSIYEINLNDRQLKLSGRVNIDESKVDKDVPYITPADEDKYYEFLIMQDNNYGNSTSVLLTLGTPDDDKIVAAWDSKTLMMIGGGAAFFIFFMCVCSCCCCTDIFSTAKSDNACCKCCFGSDTPEDTSTYKKAPLDSDALPGSSSLNQPFQGFGSDLNSKTFGIVSGGVVGASTYDYYDNTSTGLLTESQNFSRSKKQQQNKPGQKTLLNKGLGYDESHDEDNYNRHYVEEEEEEDDEDFAASATKRVVNMFGEERGESENGDDSSSSEHKSSQDGDHQTFIAPNPKKNLYSNTNLNYSRDLKTNSNSNNNNNNKLINSSSTNFNSNNYSTIDSKNLKYIKTENGLVYTPMNTMNKRNKSSDGLTNEDEHRLYQQLKEENNYDDLDRQDTTTLIRQQQQQQKKPIINTYSHVKKITNKNTLTTNSNTNLNANFQNELTLKLKTISSTKEQLEKQQQQQQETIKKPLVESNSTATTSLSSASSCMSNSDLILSKRDTNQPQPQQAQTNNTIKRPLDLTNIDTNNKNYSLLKTTLNLNSQNDVEGFNNNCGTLGRQTKPTTNSNVKNNSVYSTTTYKPPILKPKPRNNIYQTNLGGTIGRRQQMSNNNNNDSLHNQSVEPLLKETSLHTSPSTSVTDVSSNNCTPQHYTSNLVEEISRVHQQQQQQQTKATTTFATTPNGNSIIYSTTKINSNQEASNCAPTTMRTFNVNYENSTLGRKANQKKPTIDDEISKISQQQHAMAQRTLDRRHVKNSEC